MTNAIFQRENYFGTLCFSWLHLETKNNYCVQKIQIQSSEIHNISFEDFVAKIAMDQTLISPFLYSYK